MVVACGLGWDGQGGEGKKGGKEVVAGGRKGGCCGWEERRLLWVGGKEVVAGGRKGGYCGWEERRLLRVGGKEAVAGGRKGGCCSPLLGCLGQLARCLHDGSRLRIAGKGPRGYKGSGLQSVI
eukprot:351524-Chlamydomonas_euryale.AAC.3